MKCGLGRLAQGLRSGSIQRSGLDAAPSASAPGLGRVAAIGTQWLGWPWPGVVVCSLSLWRYAVHGQHAPVLVHDNLDSVVVWQKVVVESGLLFGANDSVVDSMMGGIPRAYFDSELNVFSLLNALLSPFHAYVANAAAILCVAYVGMWLLVKGHLLDREAPGRLLIAHGVAASFALLPHWPGGGLSVAGTPLLLNAFLNLRRGELRLRASAPDWLVIAAFPFYSSIVLCFAVYLLFGAVMIADLMRGTWRWRPVGAVVGLTLAYAIVEHRLLAMTLSGGDHPAHRIEFQTKLVSLAQGARDALNIFEWGQYHAPSLHTMVVLPVVLLAAVLGKCSGRSTTRLWTIIAGLAVTSLIYGVLNLAALEPLRAHVTLLRTFNFGRVHWLQPLLWYAAFATALGLLECRLRGRAAWILLPIGLQVAVVLSQAQKESRIGGRSIPFSSFYAPEVFRQIESFIGLPLASYRVVSVGMHPAVAQYNGFRTLDGYLPNYPLRYKHEFREIIAPELARDAALRSYFDDWGSRAYVFSSELQQGCRALCTKEVQAEVRELRLDTLALLERGARFVLSAVPIRTADGLQFLRRFDSPEAAWSVYLYAVTAPA